MKITKINFKKLIHEEIEKSLKETDLYDFMKGESPPPHSLAGDNTEAAQTPNLEVEADNALWVAFDAFKKAGLGPNDVMILIQDYDWER